jgi:outer membrane protein assembly factor BamB
VVARISFLFVLAFVLPAWAKGDSPIPSWRFHQEMLLGKNPIATGGDDLLFARVLSLIRVDLKTGKGPRTLSPPGCHLGEDVAVVGRMVLFHCVDQPSEERTFLPRKPTGDLVARNLDAAKVSWRLRGVLPTPLAVQENATYALRGGALLAVSLDDGRVLWRVPGIGAPRTGPAVGGDLVVVQDARGRLRAFDSATGEARWDQKLKGRLFHPPLRVEDVVWAVASVEGQRAPSIVVTGHAVKSGETLWQHSLSSALPFFPAVPNPDGILPATTGDGDRPGHLHSFDQSGHLRWQQDVATDANGHAFTPTVVGEQVLMWSGDLASFRRHGVSAFYELVSFDRKTGTRLWTRRFREPEKPTLSRPLVIGDSFIYADGETVFSWPWPFPDPKYRAAPASR